MIDLILRTIRERYKDSDGFITIDENPSVSSTGNGFMHLAFFISVLENHYGGVDYYTRFEAMSTILSAKVNGVEGLFHRNKHKSDLNSWDEYFSIASISNILDLNFAEKIVNFGEKTDWHYDNEIIGSLRIEAYHDRFFGLTSYYRYCAEKALTLIEIICIFISFLLSAFSRKADKRIKGYIQYTVLKNSKKDIFILASHIWLYIIQKRFITLGQAVSDYFGKTHPFSFLEWV